MQDRVVDREHDRDADQREQNREPLIRAVPRARNERAAKRGDGEGERVGDEDGGAGQKNLHCDSIILPVEMWGKYGKIVMQFDVLDEVCYTLITRRKDVKSSNP